jgi:hypothetical protein
MKLIDRLFDALRCLLALSLCSCVAVLLSADSASSHTPKRSPTNRICCVRHYLALTLSPQNNASVVWAPSVTVGVTSNTEIVNGTSKATATAAASIVGGGTDPNDSVTLDGSALTLNCNPAGSKCNTILSSPPDVGTHTLIVTAPLASPQFHPPAAPFSNSTFGCNIPPFGSNTRATTRCATITASATFNVSPQQCDFSYTVSNVPIVVSYPGKGTATIEVTQGSPTCTSVTLKTPLFPISINANGTTLGTLTCLLNGNASDTVTFSSSNSNPASVPLSCSFTPQNPGSQPTGSGRFTVTGSDANPNQSFSGSNVTVSYSFN